MCRLIDSSLIVPRLRVTIENLFQTANQAIIIGRNNPKCDQLTGCMFRRLHQSINDLGRIIKELEPRKVDTGCLTIDEDMLIAGYQEIKAGLIQSWEFVECRERAIFQQAANRQADAGRTGQ